MKEYISRIWTSIKTALTRTASSSSQWKVANASKNKMQLHKISLRSISTKLFILFFCAIVVLVSVGGYTSYIISKSVVKDKVAESTHETIVQSTEKADLFFSKYFDLFLQVLTDPGNADLLKLAENNEDAQSNPPKDDLKKKFSTMVSANRGIAAISLLPVVDKGIREREQSTYSNNAITFGFTEQPWFQSVLESKAPVWLEPSEQPYAVKKENLKVFALAKAFASFYGETTHMLLFEIEFDALVKQLPKLKEKNGQLYIVSGENSILYSANPKQLGQKLPFTIPTDDKTKAPQDSGLFFADVAGGEKLVVFHKSQLTGWYFIETLPTEVLVKDARKILNITIAIVLIAAAAAIFLSYLIVRMVGRPIANLNRLMKAGEQGNLNVRSAYSSNNEIGELSNSFNEMMEQISSLVKNTNASAMEVLNTAAEVAAASRRTATSAQSIADASDQITTGSTSLAENAERGNDLARSIDDEMREVLGSNNEMSHSAADVQNVSKEGTNYMNEMTEKTNSTETIIRSMVEKVDHLKDSTLSIRKILDVLNNMTKQTNILSLNATIEAARAGAAGKGFMVVADEIRKLADQSKQSIDVVGQITETIQKEIDETVKVLSDAYPIFQDQIHSVKQADTIFNKVQTQMEQFMEKLATTTLSLEGLQRSQTVLFEAINEVSAVSEQTAAMTEEVTSSSNEQLSVSNELVELSERLEKLSHTLKESLSKFSF